MTDAPVGETTSRRLGFVVVFLVGLVAALVPVGDAVGGFDGPLEVTSLGATVVEVGLLWAVAIHLRDDRYEGEDVLLVAAWTVTLALVGLCVGGTVTVTQSSAGARLVAPWLLVNHLALVGGVAGALVGSYDARSRVRARTVDRERERLADRSARLAFMNQLLRHDIRNDANVIQGYAQLLADRTDEEFAELERIERKADHVAELTTVAGDLASSLDAESEATELEPALRDAIAAVRESFPDADIRYVGDADGVTVTGTPLLSSVFTNLIRNAVQHNDRETPVVTVRSALRAANPAVGGSADASASTDVSASTDATAGSDATAGPGADVAVVTVADDGPGIDPTVREDLFAPGKRHDASTGLGLGLHLVNTIVTDLGGSVAVEENVPRGATFRVDLPLYSAE